MGSPDGERPLIVLVAAGQWWDRVAVLLGEANVAVVADPDGTRAEHCAPGASVVVIDLGLRSRSALPFCALLRRRSDVALLAVGRAGDEALLLRAFAAGADHYATDDVSPAVLVARVRALMRRVPPPLRPAPEASPLLTLVEDRAELVVRDDAVALSLAEVAAVRLLLARWGRVVTRAELLRIAALGERGDTGCDFVIRRLREKLDAVAAPARITTVRGLGFRLEAAHPTSRSQPPGRTALVVCPQPELV